MTEPDSAVVAVCQVDGVAARRDRSVVRDAVDRAVALGAGLVVLPELAACGGVFARPEEARAAAESVDGPTVALLADLSARHACVVVAGFAETADGSGCTTRRCCSDRGAVLATYRKAHLWGAEKQAFDPGRERPPVVRTSAGRVGLMVCYDLEFPEWVRLAAEGGAEILAVPANWPLRGEGDPQRPFEVVKAQAAAVTYRVNVAVADRCGVEKGIDWYGGSLVCDVDGTLLAGPACARERTVPVRRDRRSSWRRSTSQRPGTSGWVPTTTPSQTGGPSSTDGRRPLLGTPDRRLSGPPLSGGLIVHPHRRTPRALATVTGAGAVALSVALSVAPVASSAAPYTTKTPISRGTGGAVARWTRRPPGSGSAC